MPASAANDASLVMRVGSPLETTSWAALDREGGLAQLLRPAPQLQVPVRVSRHLDPAEIAAEPVQPGSAAADGAGQRGECLRPDDPIRGEPGSRLERDHRLLCRGAELTVDRPDLERLLDRAHGVARVAEP